MSTEEEYLNEINFFCQNLFNINCGCHYSSDSDSDIDFDDTSSNDSFSTEFESQTDEDNVSNYQYLNLESGLKSQLKVIPDPCSNTNLQINIYIDRIFPYKMNRNIKILHNESYWLIFTSIYDPRINTPVLIGSYNGTKNPNIKLFLTRFINDMKYLQKEGFVFSNQNFSVSLRAIICKATIRSILSCTKMHNKMHGCSKCTSAGTMLNDKVVFLNENAPLRTDEDFINRTEPCHHYGISPLETSGIMKMISQMPLEYTDLVCHGLMKKMMRQWINLKDSLHIQMKLEDIVTNYHILIPFIPYEYEHIKDELTYYKNELYNIDNWSTAICFYFFLYIAPLLLSKYLPRKLASHFNDLHYAIWVYNHPKYYKTQMNEAHEVILDFIAKYKNYYGEDQITYSVHNLAHLKNDVMKFGPLHSFSLNTLENFMNKIIINIPKNSTFNPFENLCDIQKCSKDITRSNINSVLKQKYPKVIRSLRKHLPFECTDAHEKLIFNHFMLSVSDPNNCCYLKHGQIVLIDSIGYKDKKLVIIGSEFQKKKRIPMYHGDSRNIGIFFVYKCSNLQVFSADEIEYKAVKIPLSTAGKYVIYPMII